MHRTKSGEIGGDGGVEGEFAFIPEQQDRHRGKALGHRRDAEPGVALDASSRSEMSPAVREYMDELSVNHDAADEARQVFLRGLFQVEPVEPR